MVFTGIPAPSLAPGSPEWLRMISASKVAAILGISPWDSPYSLWHKMNGNLPVEQDTDTLRRGHYLEPAIVAWFEDQHPEFDVVEAGSFSHQEHLDWVATPDRLAIMTRLTGLESWGERVGVECKSALNSWEWGAEGTAEIPPYYLAQVAWQMHITGVRRVYVPIITSNLVFKEYVVKWADVETEIPMIIDRVERFQRSLQEGLEPALDSATATYEAVKWLHPDIEDREVEIPFDLASEFLGVRDLKAAAEDKEQGLKTQIAALMGNARKATFLGSAIFTRQSRSGGTPYLVAAKNLPTTEPQRKAS